MKFLYHSLRITGITCSAYLTAQTAELDRTILPILPPARPAYSETDARNAKPLPDTKMTVTERAYPSPI